MNFLLEIGVEELPAEYARRAWDSLAHSRLLLEALGGEGNFRVEGEGDGLYTPRRLCFIAGGFPEKHPDQEVDITGPARKVAFDAEGKPTRALEGFLKGQGLALDQIRFDSTPKGEYVAARVTRRGASVRDALAKAIPLALAALPFPKTMRWELSGARFARPVRWVVALLDGAPLDFSFADVGSGTRSAGHRFYHPGFFDLAGLGRGESGGELLGRYVDKMRSHGVMVSAQERRTLISRELTRLCAQSGESLVPDPELVEITADLVEWPAMVRGTFEERYLGLPDEVIITAMREHQRYFAARRTDGKLQNAFLCVANASLVHMQGLLGGQSDPAALDALLEPIARGNERVLRARLDDAKFYWDTDLARWKKNAALPAPVQAEPLKGLTWLEGWGTVYDKMGRVARLVEKLGPDFRLDGAAVGNLQRAAWLMKLDLTMEMIKDGKEFTSLEGQMGRFYATACGEGAEVTGPMAQHCLPKVSVTDEADRKVLLRRGDIHARELAAVVAKFPGTPEARVLALLDKLDSVCGFFAAGKIPTGSEDPFGVRRFGNGVVSLLLLMDHEDEGRFQIGATSDPRAWSSRAVLRRSHIEEALRGYGDKVAPGAVVAVADSIFDFLVARLRAFLADEPTESVHSTLAAGFAASRDVFYPSDAGLRCRHMTALLDPAGDERSREDLFGLSAIFKRVSNILKEHQLDESEAPAKEHAAAEQSLLSALDAKGQKVEKSYQTQDYQAALKELLTLRAPIDQFFLDVMVMDEDSMVRDRRLKLLRRIRRLFLGGWDFSQVSVPASVS